ncbi:MAG: two-component system, OmpR family, sensor histidine kinase MprB [Pseudonocardiales bacterium]|nr:two-component system, OmpR family, sensor histidine kinase MprB [Pseudonocardiales bacterium]
MVLRAGTGGLGPRTDGAEPGTGGRASRSDGFEPETGEFDLETGDFRCDDGEFDPETGEFTPRPGGAVGDRDTLLGAVPPAVAGPGTRSGGLGSRVRSRISGLRPRVGAAWRGGGGPRSPRHRARSENAGVRLRGVELRARASEQISLRMRVALLAAIMVGLATAGISAAAFWVVRASLFADLDTQLHQRAETVVNSGLLANPANLPAAALYGSDVRVALINAQGTLITIAHSPPPPVGEPELEVASAEHPDSLRTVSDERVLAVPTGSNGFALVLAQPLDQIRHTLGGLGVVLALVGGAGVVLAGLAGATVAGAGLRPVQRLTAATERVASTGDLRPIPVTGNDELARLTHSFNLMLGAVAAAQEQQRRLVADAGHELRTPLTSLRTNVELLVASSEPGAHTLPEADRREIFDDVRGQIEELTTLVGDLVELARDDAPQAVHEPVELVDVVERSLQRAKRRAGEVRFESRLVPWTLLGDATALERAVLNLLDNAVKWSPPDGVVRVGLHPVGDGTAMLEVADGGPGIADDDLVKVFDRFYRATEDRSRPGSGLGLAIVKQVAERHGGSARAGRSAQGGALLAVQLPGQPG